MFTGIVQGIGRIDTALPRADGLRLRVDAASIAPSSVAIGDSIALDGCCLTVVAKEANVLEFDVSAATLACTAGLKAGAAVNLEQALRMGDRLGGHLVSGHVDGVGTVRAMVPSGADAQGSVTLSVEGPGELLRFIAAKGSIAVSGVSLTVNTVDDARFSVNLIPHTLAVTTLGRLAPGQRVNLEVDLIARHVARLREFD